MPSHTHKLLEPKRPALMVWCWALVLLAAGLLHAGEHRGVVTFGGLPVPGASVTARQADTTMSAVTDLEGAYEFRELSAGNWVFTVRMSGFAEIEKEVVIAAEATTGALAPVAAPPIEWTLTMLPLAAMNAQTATAGPSGPAGNGSAPTQNSGNAAGAASGGQASFQRTALNAEGGASSGNQSAEPSRPTSEAFAQLDPAELAQRASDGFLINGSTNNAAVSPFSQSLAFGNNRRGPASLYNGNIGLILGDSAFDARPFSLTGQTIPKPDYSRLQGVLAFGGPIRIPGLLRNGPNVTLNYQWSRTRNVTTQTGLMPTEAERAGDLSARPGSVLDPATGLPFAGNKIPAGRISSQAKALLALYPLPNTQGGGRYNYQAPITGATHQDDLQTRAAQRLNRQNQVYGNFAYSSTRADNPNLFDFLDRTRSTGLNTSINWLHMFTQRFYTVLAHQFSRSTLRATPFFAGHRNVSGEAGIAGNNQEPANWGPPSLSFSSGLAGLSDGPSSLTRNQTAGVSLDAGMNRGRHSLTVGGLYRRQQFNLLEQEDPRGTLAFTGATTGSDLAGFLLGIPDASSIAFGNADKYFRTSTWAAYIADDWRISPGLTVNLGIRWEYSSPITERYERLVNLDVAPGFGAIAPVVASSPSGAVSGKTYPASLLRPDHNNVAPRAGFAWRPFAASSTVVRGGYGIYHDTSVYSGIAARMAQQSPLSHSLRAENSAATPLTLANPFSAASAATRNTFGVDPGFRVGYAQNWQLSVQRDLPYSLVMLATYLGSKGTRAQQQFLPNTFPAGAADPCPACPAGFTYLTSNGNSIRHAGQLELRRRLRSGIAAGVQYTFAKSLDDAALGGRNQGGALIAQNWLDLRAERARSNFDQRHAVNLTAQYTTGMGVRGGTLLSGWRGRLFQDWTFSTQITAGTGLPLTPIYFAAVRGTGVTGSIRPDYTGSPVYDAPPGFHLNPAAYRAPEAGRWGNAGRNSITGPSQFTMNASVGRAFRLGDRWNLDFRLDALNALNHPVFPAWNTLVTSAQFGLPDRANPMRTVQAAARLRF